MSFVAGAGARTGTRGGVSRTGLSGLYPYLPYPAWPDAVAVLDRWSRRGN
jgi:hypothetical protein